MITELVSKLQKKTDLTYHEMSQGMAEILSGRTTNDENRDFLSHLAAKGETDDELLGMLDEMQRLSLRVNTGTKEGVIDMCGTGGDRLGTLNISTAASFVVAAAGGRVAKHGNHSSSGISGSADIFEYFGYDLNADPTSTATILQKYNICFMFAQKFHPAMRHVSKARMQIGSRTAFNLLGPLSNPAGVHDQLVGVSSVQYLNRLPLILKRRGARTVMTVHSDGMDEFSTCAANHVCMLQDGKITSRIVDSENLGLHKSKLQDLKVKTREDATRSFVRVLENKANQAMTETVVLNAAGGLIVAGISSDFEDAVRLAQDTLESNKAFLLLAKFVRDTGDISKLEEMRHG